MGVDIYGFFEIRKGGQWQYADDLGYGGRDYNLFTIMGYDMAYSSAMMFVEMLTGVPSIEFENPRSQIPTAEFARRGPPDDLSADGLRRLGEAKNHLFNPDNWDGTGQTYPYLTYVTQAELEDFDWQATITTLIPTRIVGPEPTDSDEKLKELMGAYDQILDTDFEKLQKAGQVDPTKRYHIVSPGDITLADLSEDYSEIIEEFLGLGATESDNVRLIYWFGA